MKESESEWIEKSARIIAITMKYRKLPFPFTVPKSDSSGAFVTGQSITEEKMFGKKELTPTERRSLGFADTSDIVIIHPDMTYPLVHGRKFDLSYKVEGQYKFFKNPKDHAEFEFFISLAQVAKGKAAVLKGKHDFYVEDLEAEAEIDNSKTDLRFEAMKMVMETPTTQLGDIAMLLNYEADGFNVNPDVLSPGRLKQAIMEQVDKNPEIILKLKDDDSKETIFVLRLVKANIIRKSGRDYYHGTRFIGTTITSIKEFIRKKEQISLVDKWAKQLNLSPELATTEIEEK